MFDNIKANVDERPSAGARVQVGAVAEIGDRLQHAFAIQSMEDDK